MKIFGVLIKILVVLLFLANTGIFKEFARAASEERKYKNDLESNRMVMELCEKLYVAATLKVNNGETYSPYDYFRDLSAIYQLEDSLGTNVGFLAPHGVSDLQMISMKFINGKQFSYADVEKARVTIFKNRGDLARDRFFQEAEKRTWPVIWRESLSPWITYQYLAGLPLALIWLLFWIWEGKKDGERFSLKNPFAFIFSLAIYPLFFTLVFMRWARNTSRGMYAEIELRRTKEKFLAVLSNDELAAIKKFAKSKFELIVWQENLKDRGLTIRHSFIFGVASFAVCLMVLGPNQAWAKEKLDVSSRLEILTINQVNEIDWNSGDGKDDGFFVNSAILPAVSSLFVKNGYFSSEYKSAGCAGWLKNIDHVPVSRLVKLGKLTNFLTNLKETENEKLICYIRVFYLPPSYSSR